LARLVISAFHAAVGNCGVSRSGIGFLQRAQYVLAAPLRVASCVGAGDAHVQV
jgi:hypothetical protein